MWVVYLVSVVIAVILLLLLFWRFWFLRCPDVLPPEGKTIASPADGKVIKIVKVGKKDLTIPKGTIGKINTLTKDVFKKGYLVVIMMTVMDVHYQRAPLDGKVISSKHKKGKYLNAVFGASLQVLENEKNEILINTKIGKIKIIQIAGLLARRINSFVRKNQTIKKGEIIGLINLGSQVCILLPEKARLRVVKNQKVKAGKTIIAEY